MGRVPPRQPESWTEAGGHRQSNSSSKSKAVGGGARSTRAELSHLYQAVGFLPVGAHVAKGAVDFFFRYLFGGSGQDGCGLALGSFQQLTVTDQVGHLEAGHAGLASAEELARAA